MSARRVFAVGLLVLTGLLSPAQAQDAPLTVIASTSILADIAGQVAGDAARVDSLFPLGVNAHTAEPSAQDIIRLSDADLVLIVGAHYEEGLADVLEEAAGDNVVSVSMCVPVRPVTFDLEVHEAETPEDAAHSEDESEVDLEALCSSHEDAVKAAFDLDEIAVPGTLGPLYTLECEGDHAAGGCDPHMWTDPVNVALWTLFIRDTLIERDPAHADTYTANADAYVAQLVTLDEQISTQISAIPQGRRVMLTNHLTFGYFAARYELRLVGVIIPGGSTTSEPSTQDILGLIQMVQEYQVPAIFTENVVSDSLAAQIADETGARIVPLYTESLGEPGSGAETYLDYLEWNASAIAGALE